MVAEAWAHQLLDTLAVVHSAGCTVQLYKYGFETTSVPTSQGPGVPGGFRYILVYWLIYYNTTIQQ